jgi:hypothetical protein
VLFGQSCSNDNRSTSIFRVLDEILPKYEPDPPWRLCRVFLSLHRARLTTACKLNYPMWPTFQIPANKDQHVRVADTVVWLNFRKCTYYSKGQKRYAHGLDGNFICRSEFSASGYRSSLFGIR